MADTYEKDLAQKSSLTTSDFIRVVGSDNVSYKQAVTAVANTIGAYYSTPILLTDCNDATDPSKVYYANGSTANRPSNAWFFIKCEAKSGSMLFQNAYYMNSTDVVVYQRSRNTGGTWGAWVQVPTRAEVDALKNRVISRNVSVGASITLGTRNVKATITFIGSSGLARGIIIISGYPSSATDYTTIGGNITGVSISVSGGDMTITNNTTYTLNVYIDVYAGTPTIS